MKSTGYVKPLFKDKFIKDNGIKYWPEVRVCDDCFFCDCLVCGAKVEVLDQTGYIYTTRNGSISGEMKVLHVIKLLNFDKKFMQVYNLTHLELTAQKKHYKNLDCAYHYLILVQKIKKLQIFSALLKMSENPSSARLLSLPIKKGYFFGNKL